MKFLYRADTPGNHGQAKGYCLQYRGLAAAVITKDLKLIGDVPGEVVLNIDFKGFKAFEVLRMDSGYFHLAPLGHSFSQVKKNGNTTIDKETEQE